MSILSDEDAFGNITIKSHKVYQAVSYDFKDFSQLDSRFPNEMEVIDYFKMLREVNKLAFSTL